MHCIADVLRGKMMVCQVRFEVVCCSVLRCVLCVADALYSRYAAREDDDLLGLLQCVAVCCGVLRCVTVCCRVSQCIL